MGRFGSKKTLIPHNKYKGFKAIRIWLFDLNAPSEQFMDINTNFHIINLQVEKVLGECPHTTKLNACHNMLILKGNLMKCTKLVAFICP